MSDSLWLVDRFDPGLLSLKPIATILVLAVTAVSSLKSMSFFFRRPFEDVAGVVDQLRTCGDGGQVAPWQCGLASCCYWPSDGRLGLF